MFYVVWWKFVLFDVFLVLGDFCVWRKSGVVLWVGFVG